MMKKVRRVGMESSPSSSSFPVGEEAKARFKHMCLIQDYEELLKESEAKKNKLQWVIQKKLKLMAEVKFLQRKYKSLSKKPSQETPYRLKKQSHKVQSQPVRIAPSPKNPVIQREFSSKDRNQRAREAAIPSTSTVLDLNQVSFPSAEEMQEFQVEWEPLKVDKSKMCSMEGGAVADDLNLLICRDVGNGSSRVGKRRISWQDQVALRV